MIDIIIMCGGENERIKHLLPEGVPKCLADINGTPFIDLLVPQLNQYFDVNRYIFCGGYGASKLWNHVKNNNIFNRKLDCVVTNTQKGTTYALLDVEVFIETENFLVLNGDTYFDDILLEDLAKDTKGNTHYLTDKHTGIYCLNKNYLKNLSNLESCGGTWEQTIKGSMWDIGTPEGLNNFRNYMKNICPTCHRPYEKV